MNFHSMGKVKYQIRHWLIPQDIFYWAQFTRNNFSTFPKGIKYGYPDKLRIGCEVMFLTSSGMDKYHHTKITILGVRVYIINGCVTRKNIDDISYYDYLIVYIDTKWVILYWNT